MKKIIWVVGLMLLLLTSCGTEEAPFTQEENAPGPAQVQLEGLSMEMEHDTYDPSLREYTYLISNMSEAQVCFGAAYSVEKQTAFGWAPLPLKQDWTAIAYILEPGEKMALRCTLTATSDIEEGTYRLLKEVETGENQRQVLVADFALGESPYTADSPYGFLKMEALPEHYDAAAGDSDGAVTYTEKGLQNENAIIQFLNNVKSNIPCQIRLVQEFSEGTVMVQDAIYENDKFCWKVRSGGGISQEFYSYLITDGRDIYLANGADWYTAEKYGGKMVQLVPAYSETLSEAAELVQNMTNQRLEESTMQYQTWSGDGQFCAGFNSDRDELFVQGPDRGEAFPVQLHSGVPAKIRALTWEADGVLLVYTNEEAHLFDPSQWVLH